MNNMGARMKRFVKHLITYNPLDYFIPRLRAFYRKLGILDYLDSQTYWVLWKIVRALKRKAFPGKTTGVANVPMTGAGIFIANHSHLFDPFFSASQVHREVHWLSKIENFYTPFFRPILQTTGCIPVRRGQSDANAIRLVRQKLEKGKMVGIFPEGTRTRTGVLGRFHTGAARMCMEYGIPYVPCVVINSYKCKIGDRIDVHIGKPRYPPKGIEVNYENVKWFTDLMRQDIVALLKKHDLKKTIQIPKHMEEPALIPMQYRELYAAQTQ